MPKKDKEKLEPLIFRIYDTNGDGVVDFVELMVVLHCLQEGTPEEVLGNLFRVFDLDNDGSISRFRLVATMFDDVRNRKYNIINQRSQFGKNC